MPCLLNTLDRLSPLWIVTIFCEIWFDAGFAVLFSVRGGSVVESMFVVRSGSGRGEMFASSADVVFVSFFVAFASWEENPKKAIIPSVHAHNIVIIWGIRLLRFDCLSDIEL